MLLANVRLDLRIVAVIALVALFALATACGSKEEAGPSDPAATAPAPAIVAPDPVAPSPPAEPVILNMGISEEPSTRNYWNYFGGTGGSVWTAYVLDGIATTLYDYSHQRFAHETQRVR